MPFGYTIASNAMVFWGLSSVLAGTGGALVAYLNTEIETIVLKQEQHDETAERRNTILKKYGDSNLYLEYSHINDDQKPYIFDHLSEKIVPYVYYLVNANKKIIRLSRTILPKEHKGIYKTWILHEFKHSGFESSLYGYCPPQEITEDIYKVCNHLPEEWTIKPL